MQDLVNCSGFRQPLIELGMSFYIGSLIFTVISSAALGIFVYLQAKGKKENTLLAILALIVSLWCFLQILGEISGNRELVLLWTRLNIAAATFIPIVYLHFILVFTKRFDRSNKTVLWSTYLIGSGFLVLDLTPLFIADIAPRQGFKFYPVGGPAYPFFALFIAAVAIYALIELILSLKGAGQRRKNQMFYVILASAASYIGGISAFAPAFNIAFPVLTPYAMPLYIALVVYAIVRHRLLDIRVVVRKGILYSVLTAFFTLVYGLFILLISRFFEGAGVVSPLLSTALTVLILILLFQPLRERIQKLIDRLFFREKYVYQRTLKDLSEDAVSIIDPEELVKKVKGTLKKVLKARKVEIKKGPEEPRGHELVIPLQAKGKRVGSLCLSEKLSEEDYSPEDIDLLRTLANQIAIALENADLYQELLRADKLKAVGILAAGMAHEIKNPLASLKGMTQILPENLKDPEFVGKYAEMVPRQLDRLNLIVEDLLKLGKPPRFAKVELDPNKVLEEVISFQKDRCEKKGIRISKELSEGLKIKADPQQLHQAFLNLLLNAMESMPDGGELKIQSAKRKDKICIEFSDTGKGIPLKDLKNIFDPFFTTKEGGTGMGLAVVYRMIKGHGGEIEVASKENEGTKFTICL